MLHAKDSAKTTKMVWFDIPNTKIGSQASMNQNTDEIPERCRTPAQFVTEIGGVDDDMREGSEEQSKRGEEEFGERGRPCMNPANQKESNTR